VEVFHDLLVRQVKITTHVVWPRGSGNPYRASLRLRAIFRQIIK
jgi:hypothetical protein